MALNLINNLQYLDMVRISDLTDPDGIYLGDIAGNGFQDILVCESMAGDLFWFEQIGELGPWIQHTIAINLNKIEGCLLIDVDNSGELIAVAADQTGDQIVIYKRDAAPQGTWSSLVLDAAAINGQDLRAWDIDGDGQDEIVASISGDDLNEGFVVWYDYTGGGILNGANWDKYTMTTSKGAWALSVDRYDFNGNGNADEIVLTSRNVAVGHDAGIHILTPTAIVTNPWTKTTIENRDQDWARFDVGNIRGTSNLDIIACDVLNNVTPTVYEFADSWNAIQWPDPHPTNGFIYNIRLLNFGLDRSVIFWALDQYGFTSQYFNGRGWETDLLESFAYAHPCDEYIPVSQLNYTNRTLLFLANSGGNILSYLAFTNPEDLMAASWYSDSQWQKEFALRAANVYFDFVNLTFYIRLDDPDLINAFREDGADIVFTDENGNLLERDIISFDRATPDGKVAVRIPTGTAAEGATIIMQWGGASVNVANSTLTYTNHNVMYPMESEAGAEPDRTANGYDGTVTGAVRGVASQLLNGMDFEEGDNQDRIANNDAGNFNYNQPFSGAIWIRRERTARTMSLLSRIDTVVGRGWRFYFANTDRLRMQWQNAVGQRIIVETTETVIGALFHRLSFSYDGSNLAAGCEIRRDGQDSTMNTLSDTLGANSILSTEFVIGANKQGAGHAEYFDGLMDHAYIVDYEWTQQEDQTRYDNENLFLTNGVFDLGATTPRPAVGRNQANKFYKLYND